jgi:hypothetical protein
VKNFPRQLKTGVEGAGYPVIKIGDGSRYAAHHRITEFVPVTEETIVTTQWGPGDTKAARTLLSEGTGIPIVAGRRVVEMKAARNGVTDIVSAEISVVTGDGICTITDPIGADIRLGTYASVVAWDIVGHLDAAAGRIACVICTGVAIVAVRGFPANTQSACAGVVACAGVSILTGGALQGIAWHMKALFRDTNIDIFRADIVVITRRVWGGQTDDATSLIDAGSARSREACITQIVW